MQSAWITEQQLLCQHHSRDWAHWLQSHSHRSFWICCNYVRLLRSSHFISSLFISFAWFWASLYLNLRLNLKLPCRPSEAMFVPGCEVCGGTEELSVLLFVNLWMISLDVIAIARQLRAWKLEVAWWLHSMHDSVWLNDVVFKGQQGREREREGERENRWRYSRLRRADSIGSG